MTRENIPTILIAVLFTYHFINQVSSGFSLMLMRIKKKNPTKPAVGAVAAQFGMTIVDDLAS